MKKNIYKNIIKFLILVVFITPVFSKFAHATNPLIVTTGSASLIGVFSATLTGTVFNPNPVTNYNSWFEYSPNQTSLNNGGGQSTSPSYGTLQPYTSATSSIVINFTNLYSSNPVTYYFRICETDISGIVCGSSNSFTTLANTTPPVNQTSSTGVIGAGVGGAANNTFSTEITNVLTYNAINLHDTSAKLTGSGTILNSQNHYAYFRYSKITDNPPIFCNDIYGSAMRSIASTSPNTNGSFIGSGNFSATVQGLEPDTSYAYCAVISNSATNLNMNQQYLLPPTDIQYGGVKYFTTKCGTTCTTILTKSVSDVTPTTAYLNGQFNSTKTVTTSFEYTVDPATLPPVNGHPATANWQTVNIENHIVPQQNGSTSASGGLKKQLTGLTPNTSYLFRAVAQTDWGVPGSPAIQSYSGETLSFVTRPPASTPEVPTDPGIGTGNLPDIIPGDWTDGAGGPCSSLTLNNISNRTVRVGNNLSLSTHYCGAQGEVVTYGIIDQPGGSYFNPANSSFTWRPTFTQIGPHIVKINATTPSGNDAEEISFTINVIASNTNCNTLTIEPIPDQNYDVGQTGNLNVNVCGNNGEVVTYGADGLPAGAGINHDNGYFSWFPTEDQIGPHDIIFTASTPSQNAVSVTVHFIISASNNAPLNPNDPNNIHGNSVSCPNFKINPISNKNVQVGSPISFTVHTCGNQGQPVTYSITSTLMPSNASIDHETGIFSWHTGPNQSGTYEITVHAGTPIGAIDLTTGNHAIVNATPVTVQIKVNALPVDCPTLKINPISNITAFVGQPETFYATVCGDHGQTVTYGADSLPTNAGINPETGFFSWTPTINQLGINNITIMANTTSQRTVTDIVHINVKNINNNPFSGNVNGNNPFSNGTSNGSNPFGNGTFGSGIDSNGNSSNGSGGNSPTVLGSLNNPAPALGSALVPPYSDVVRYHEGIEHVFTRQIVGDISLARIYGYQDGQNLQIFAGNLAHSFATMFGYYHGGGREIRVITPDIAAYQLGLKDGMLAVYEYYDNHLTGVATATGSLKETFEYEYYFH
ncbi:MAG: putative Ig domain-containing protein [Candidatus Nomurabacteria bacterium]|nr:putative Ig domain-containing protein [Candidatus Nomurabacteria bacterium]